MSAFNFPNVWVTFGKKLYFFHIWLLWGMHWYVKRFKISHNISLMFHWNTFWPLQKWKSDFQFCFIGVCGNDGVWRPTWIFKGHIYSRESNGTRFDHGQFEIEILFPSYVPPFYEVCTLSVLFCFSLLGIVFQSHVGSFISTVTCNLVISVRLPWLHVTCKKTTFLSHKNFVVSIIQVCSHFTSLW